MIVFVIPWFVNVIYPYMFFMFCKVAIDFMIKFCYELMVGVGVSEVISVLYFGEDVLWDWFIAFIYVATWYI